MRPLGNDAREHDPRITVIQQELFDERKSKVDKYRDLVDRPARAGAADRVRAGHARRAHGCQARWACSCARSCIRWCSARVGRNVVFGVNVTLRHPHKIAIGDNVVIDDSCCLDAKGTDNKGITIGDGRVRRPQHDPQLQERRHRHRRPRQSRLQLRDLLGVARAGGEERPDGGLHLPGRRRSSVRSRRHPGARAGTHRARHRRRRQRLARHARGRHRRLAHRPRRDHRRRRRRRRRDSGVRDRDGHPGEGDDRRSTSREWRSSETVAARCQPGSATGDRETRTGTSEIFNTQCAASSASSNRI